MSSPAYSGPPLAPYTPVNAADLAKRTTTALLVIAVIILLIGAAGFFFINSQIQQQLAVQADKSSKLGTAQQIADREATATAAYDSVEDQLRYVEQPTDVKSYVPTLLPQIAALAQSYNLHVTSITPGAIVMPPAAPAQSSDADADSSDASAPAQPTYETMPLSVSLTGNYRQVMKYIYGLIRFPKVVSVKQISLHPQTSAPATAPGGGDTVTASLQMVAYVFIPDADAKSATSTGTSAPATATSAPAAQPVATPYGQSQTIPPGAPNPMHGAMMPTNLPPPHFPAQNLPGNNSQHSARAAFNALPSPAAPSHPQH